jgi:hypothetical protein
VVLDTQEEILLSLGWTFLRDVNARIDVGAGKIRFRIGQRNMTFKFQVKEEQCYLVQDKEARGGGSHDPNTRETRWPQSNPRTTHPTGAINPKSQRKLTRLRGKKTEIKDTPAKSTLTSSPPKKTKVWHMKRV